MKKTKNIILLISGIVGGGLILSEPISNSQICTFFNHANSINCVNSIFDTAMIFYIFPFIFIFSLITYFLRDEIFHAWLKFTYVWAPFSMFLVLITPGDTGGGFMPSLIDKQMTAILMSGLFVIISLLIIIVKLVKLHWKK